MPNGSEQGGSTGRTIEAFKKTFFDPKAVLDPAEKMARRTLSKFGAFVRQRSRTSIRYREKPSSPGSPPSAHRTMARLKKPRKGKPITGKTKRQLTSPLRDFIFFGYEQPTQSVIIGPALTNQASRSRPVHGTVPQVEEEGGQITITKTGARGQKKTRTVTIAARPYMRPAYEAEFPKFMESLKDSIKPAG